MSKTRKNPQYTTPLGVAVYPKLNEPDNYEGKVQYKSKLVVDRDTAQPLMDAVEAHLKASIEEYNNRESTKKKVNLKKALASGLPWDDHDEDDSKVVFYPKQNYEVDEYKNGQKTGKKRKVTLIFYDAKGDRIPPDQVPELWGGSKIKLSGSMRFYPGLSGGVSLSITAVQIVDLVTRGQGAGPDAGEAFGFGQEDGFEFTSEPTEFEADTADVDQDEDDDDPDF